MSGARGGVEREAGRGPLAYLGPAQPRPLAPRRLARLRQEAQEQEQRQAEERARRTREEQAWMQLKEQEVLQLQVGRGSGGVGAPGRADSVNRGIREKGPQGNVCEAPRAEMGVELGKCSSFWPLVARAHKEGVFDLAVDKIIKV